MAKGYAFGRGTRLKPVDISKKLSIIKNDEELKKLIQESGLDDSVFEELKKEFHQEVEQVDKKKNILIPAVRECNDYNYLRTKFERPSHYIRHVYSGEQATGIRLDDQTIVHYDLLKDDEEFLKKINMSLNCNVSEDDFCKLIDKFEKLTGKWVDGSEKIDLKDALNAAVQFKMNYKKNVIKDIYDYWVSKRKKLGKPLLRTFWTSAQNNLPNYVVFRPRIKEKMTLRKHKKKSFDSVLKMHKLIEDFKRLDKILKKIRQRDEKKLLLVQINAMLFDQRRNEIKDDTYVCPMWYYFKDYKLEKIYKKLKNRRSSRKSKRKSSSGFGLGLGLGFAYGLHNYPSRDNEMNEWNEDDEENEYKNFSEEEEMRQRNFSNERNLFVDQENKSEEESICNCCCGDQSDEEAFKQGLEKSELPESKGGDNILYRNKNERKKTMAIDDSAKKSNVDHTDGLNMEIRNADDNSKKLKIKREPTVGTMEDVDPSDILSDEGKEGIPLSSRRIVHEYPKGRVHSKCEDVVLIIRRGRANRIWIDRKCVHSDIAEDGSKHNLGMLDMVWDVNKNDVNVNEIKKDSRNNKRADLKTISDKEVVGKGDKKQRGGKTTSENSKVRVKSEPIEEEEQEEEEEEEKEEGEEREEREEREGEGREKIELKKRKIDEVEKAEDSLKKKYSKLSHNKRGNVKMEPSDLENSIKEKENSFEQKKNNINEDLSSNTYNRNSSMDAETARTVLGDRMLLGTYCREDNKNIIKKEPISDLTRLQSILENTESIIDEWVIDLNHVEQEIKKQQKISSGNFELVPISESGNQRNSKKYTGGTYTKRICKRCSKKCKSIHRKYCKYFNKNIMENGKDSLIIESGEDNELRKRDIMNTDQTNKRILEYRNEFEKNQSLYNSFVGDKIQRMQVTEYDEHSGYYIPCKIHKKNKNIFSFEELTDIRINRNNVMMALHKYKDLQSRLLCYLDNTTISDDNSYNPIIKKYMQARTKKEETRS